MQTAQLTLNSSGAVAVGSAAPSRFGWIIFRFKNQAISREISTFGAFRDMPWNKKRNPDILKKQKQKNTKPWDVVFCLIFLRGGGLFKGVRHLGKPNCPNRTVPQEFTVPSEMLGPVWLSSTSSPHSVDIPAEVFWHKLWEKELIGCLENFRYSLLCAQKPVEIGKPTVASGFSFVSGGCLPWPFPAWEANGISLCSWVGWGGSLQGIGLEDPHCSFLCSLGGDTYSAPQFSRLWNECSLHHI